MLVMLGDSKSKRISRCSFICRHPWLLAWPRATNLGLSADRPPTLRVCARAVRATRSPRAHGSLPYGQPSAPVGLRIRAYSSPLRGLLPAACSARPTPPSGLMQGLRGRVVSVRHARPAAHTLRAVVRSAAVTRSSAPVQSIGQRGRQRLTACCCLRSGNSNLTRTYSNLEARRSPAPAETHLAARLLRHGPRYSVLLRFTPLFAGRSTCRGAPSGLVVAASRLAFEATPSQVRFTPSSGASVKHTEL
jgi:hypothetical protein